MKAVEADHLTHVPTPLTPFWGRKAELQDIQKLLLEPGCRLLTLIGPGGMGKTRLAIEAARAQFANFGGKVFFVELQSLASGDLLPVTLIDAFGIACEQEDSWAHLLRYLADQNMLLVLDNFENLLGDAWQLTNLLVHAPGVKLMLTSREALNLQEEWLYPVGGMDLPDVILSSQAGDGKAEQSSAVQMFAACARRVRPDFSLEKELESVIEICTLVDGMPLAIELAASWTRLLSCAIIAREIKENIRFLASSLRNIPERHRSIVAVFEQTWRMLSPDEQRAYQYLSVFQGGFDQGAAQQVAQASPATLLSLLDKSLLRRVSSPARNYSTERFGLHHLLCQFAHENLSRKELEQFSAYNRHSDYYLSYLRQRNADFLGKRQQAAVQEVRAELENVLAAWRWASQKGQSEKLRDVVQPLDSFFQFQSRFVEGAVLFEETIEQLKTHPGSEASMFTQAQLLTCLGWYFIRLGQFDRARAALENAKRQYEAVQLPPPPGMGTDPSCAFAILAVIRGDYCEAVRLGEQVQQVSEARGDLHNLASAYYVLASAWLGQGEYEVARQYAQLTSDQFNALKDEWSQAYGLLQWGEALHALGDTQQARRLFLESYRIRKSFGDPEGMALALHHLGNVALTEKEYSEAQRFFQESHDIYATIFDQGGLAAALNGLGSVKLKLGQLAEARDDLSRALRVAAEIHFIPSLMSILVSSAELLILSGERTHGLDLLQFALSSKASDQETRRQAVEKMACYDPSRKDHSDRPATRVESLDQVVEELLADMERLTFSAAESEPVQSARNASLSSLVEPLTDREIEILRCLNDGLSNKDIAERLFLSPGTVKWYTSQIYGKLEVSSRTQAVAKARSLNLLSA